MNIYRTICYIINAHKRKEHACSLVIPSMQVNILTAAADDIKDTHTLACTHAYIHKYAAFKI